MQLYFARHGKTKQGLRGHYQEGSGSSPLLPKSYEDIKRLAEHLKGTKFRTSYASPLQRVSTTAAMLRGDMGVTTVPVVVDGRLRELSLSDLEGMKFIDAGSQYPDQIKAFRYSPECYDPSTFRGEDFEHMIKRGKSLVSDIVKRYPNKDGKVFLMNHGAALCALTRTLEGYDVVDIRKRGGLTNTSPTILDTESQGEAFSGMTWNETSYLDQKITSRGTI